MKKTVTLVLMMVGITAFAQQNQTPLKEKPNFTPEQLAELRSKELALQIDLNASQIKQVQALVLKNARERQDFQKNQKTLKVENGERPTDDELFKMKNERLDKQLAYQGEMKKILTPEQFAKWTESRDDKMKKIKQNQTKRDKPKKS